MRKANLNIYVDCPSVMPTNNIAKHQLPYNQTVITATLEK